MPLYLYACTACFKSANVFLKLADLDKPVICSCSGTMQRQVVAPFVRGDYAPYECPITGKMIEGRRAHEENLKKHGCRLWEPGETQAVMSRRAAEEEAFNRELDRSIEEEIYKLPTEKRDKLAAEMEGGLTAEVIRKSV